MSRREDDDPIARRSRTLSRLFGWYLRWYLCRNFHGVRASRSGASVPAPGRPLIIYSNHSSWWDPALYLLLQSMMFPDRAGFGPMDSRAIEKYRLFRKFGVFGVDVTSPRGAAQFLRTSTRILSDPTNVFWVTAEGAFTDPRRRPIVLRPGLAHLVRRVPDAWVVPLAVEYIFWNESRPEALFRFGAPLQSDAAADVATWTERLERELTATMDVLADESATRNAGLFVPVIRGGAGVGGVYDLWRRSRALLAGQPFDASHGGKT